MSFGEIEEVLRRLTFILEKEILKQNAEIGEVDFLQAQHRLHKAWAV